MSKAQDVIDLLEAEQNKIMEFQKETTERISQWEEDPSFKERQEWIRNRNQTTKNMLEEYKAKTAQYIGISDDQKTNVLDIYKVIVKAIENSRD